MRNAVNQAGQAFNQAGQTADQFNGAATGISSNLTPALTSEMLHPQGLGQEGIAAETGATLGGAGGADAGLVGQANQMAAASRNSGGFQAALGDAARERMKAAAGSSEGIEAQNENLKQSQRQAGAGGLEKMYGIDTSGQLDAMGQQANDINAEVNASKTGWLQNTMGVLQDINGMATGAGSMGVGFGKGQTWGKK